LNEYLITAIFYLVIFVFGFFLTFAGTPYNTVVITIHKLTSIVLFIVLYRFYSSLRSASNVGPLVTVSSVITALLFICTVITGGLVSMDKEFPEIILMVHRIAPFLTVFSTFVSLYLLVNT
jgi:hypothetical protein